MKTTLLRKLPDTLERLMQTKNISAKELAEKSKMSYSSLMPILNGSRECGISKLVALADALDCTPDALLQGLYHSQNADTVGGGDKKPAPKYLAVFISIVKVTYCLCYEVETGKSVRPIQQFPVRCGDEADFFHSNLLIAFDKFSKEFDKIINPKEVAVFASVQQYGRRMNRQKIQNKGNAIFSSFFMESDAVTNHDALLSEQNGICVTINTGDVITYSTDNGKNIIALQGYGFPISDTAGNYWLGCEAIKHVINVKEQRESSSLVSDRLLALFNDDLNFLAASTMEDPREVYLKASSVVKELMYHQKSYEIVKRSFDLLFKDIQFIDERTKTKLPIIVSGDLEYLYEDFFPKDRLIKRKEQQSTILLDHALKKLQSLVQNNSESTGEKINAHRNLPFL